MKLLESNRYISDLRKVIESTNLDAIEDRTFFITGVK